MRPLIKCYGGKAPLAKWLVDHLPEDIADLNYTEPFAGGASLLLNKPFSKTETVNDLDKGLMTLWNVVKGRHEDFLTRIENWAYSEESFERALTLDPDKEKDPEMSLAVKEYVLRRMSQTGMKKAFSWSTRLRGGKPGDQNAWETMLSHIPKIHDRIKNVNILNQDGIALVENSGPEDFLYLDPPYVKSTRYKGSTNVYSHEMTDKDHDRLLKACLGIGAKVMVSGYQCPLYTSKLRDWKFSFKPVANHASQCDRKQIKIEGLWRNY